MPKSYRPSFDKFLSAMHHPLCHADAEALKEMQAAIHVASAIVLTGNVLDCDAKPLTGFLDREYARIDADPALIAEAGCELNKAAARDRLTYYVGIALGLLLADVTR